MVSSANLKSLISVLELGGKIPCIILGFSVMSTAVSSVKRYKGMNILSLVLYLNERCEPAIYFNRASGTFCMRDNIVQKARVVICCPSFNGGSLIRMENKLREVLYEVY